MIRNSCRCFCVELVKPLPCIDIVLIFFHYLVLQEHWELKDSKITLKTVLGGMGIVALSIGCHEQNQ